MGNMGLPKRATLKAFIRSTTLSLGSIAFGSLIVTILELIRLILQVVQQQEAAQGDMVGQIIACCAVCCISCITSLVEWFNKYAYIEISLYGKAYIPAAKDTWRLMKDRGIDALINDSLVGTGASSDRRNVDVIELTRSHSLGFLSEWIPMWAVRVPVPEV